MPDMPEEVSGNKPIPENPGTLEEYRLKNGKGRNERAVFPEWFPKFKAFMMYQETQRQQVSATNDFSVEPENNNAEQPSDLTEKTHEELSDHKGPANPGTLQQFSNKFYPNDLADHSKEWISKVAAYHTYSKSLKADEPEHSVIITSAVNEKIEDYGPDIRTTPIEAKYKETGDVIEALQGAYPADTMHFIQTNMSDRDRKELILEALLKTNPGLDRNNYIPLLEGSLNANSEDLDSIIQKNIESLNKNSQAIKTVLNIAKEHNLTKSYGALLTATGHKLTSKDYANALFKGQFRILGVMVKHGVSQLGKSKSPIIIQQGSYSAKKNIDTGRLGLSYDELKAPAERIQSQNFSTKVVEHSHENTNSEENHVHYRE